MQLGVDFWDVGQGDCSVVRLPDGRLLIIAFGPPDSPVIEWLAARREGIYGVVLTHNDEDHAGCFPDLLERFATKIENVFLLIDRHTTELSAKRILSCAIRYWKKRLFKLHHLIVPDKDVLPIYGHVAGENILMIYAVYPESGMELANQLKKAPTPNVVSAIVCLDINEATKVVWAGDAMRTVADRCQGKRPEVMVGPHHGGPTDRNLKNHHLEYEKVVPNNVFISAGTANPHDHPVKRFIDYHRRLGHRVVCSQLMHCDPRRVANRQHVRMHHLKFGMAPPQNAGTVSCRGPMRLTRNPNQAEFDHDEYHGQHLAEVCALHRPYCLDGLKSHANILDDVTPCARGTQGD
jgi:hypothetical protein